MKILIPILILLMLYSCNDPSSQSEKSIDLEELSISEIHMSFERGVYNSEELVSAYLARIEEKDHLINSISYINPDALLQARNLDKEYKETGILRPLHGIPMLVKDNFNTIGMPTSAGSLALKDFIPDENATMVQQLIDAGAIIIAKTNMAEWAFSPMHTESSTHGTTRNPYNLDYVPAGSSGGTAAAVAANFGVIGLGTDTGNSIRGPSAHNALVGFRSSMGLTSRYGVIPLYLRNDIAGPMCRSVEDACKVFDVIAGRDEKDIVTIDHNYDRPEDYRASLGSSVQGMRVGILNELLVDIDPEVRILFDSAVMDLRSIGIEVVEDIVIENFDDLRRNQWCDVFRSDLEDYLKTFVRNDTISTLEDISRIGTKSNYAEESISYFLDATKGRSGNPEIPCDELSRDIRSTAFRNAILSEMEAKRLNALIYPSWNFAPARIDHFSDEYKGDNSQVVSPHTGLPAFTVPMGYLDLGLPSGLQFLGRMFGEEDLIKLLDAYEEKTQHRVPPILK